MSFKAINPRRPDQRWKDGDSDRWKAEETPTKKAIWLRFLNERNKSNPKYLDMISKVRQIEILKKEIKEKIEIIFAKLFILIDYLYRLTFVYIL